MSSLRALTEGPQECIMQYVSGPLLPRKGVRSVLLVVLDLSLRSWVGSTIVQDAQ